MNCNREIKVKKKKKHFLIKWEHELLSGFNIWHRKAQALPCKPLIHSLPLWPPTPLPCEPSRSFSVTFPRKEKRKKKSSLPLLLLFPLRYFLFSQKLPKISISLAFLSVCPRKSVYVAYSLSLSPSLLDYCIYKISPLALSLFIRFFSSSLYGSTSPFSAWFVIALTVRWIHPYSQSRVISRESI